MIPNLHLWALALAALHTAGFLHACHALMHARTSQGTIAWVACLLSVPWAAIPLYWILGRHRFHGYVDARRDADSPLAESFRKTLEELEAARDFTASSPSRLTRSSEKLGGLPATDDNATRLLIDGEETYTAIFDAIAAAQHYLLVEFFIVQDDDAGRRFRDALIERQRAGVQVYFLYDEVGSRSVSKAFLASLVEAGAKAKPFGTNRGRGNRFQVNFRNHRKIVVADGELALLGGLNIGDEYLGKNPRFGHWRDTHLSVRGSAAAAVQFAFLGDWNWAAGEVLEGMRWLAPSDDGAEGDKRVTIVPTSPADAFDTCLLFFLEAVNSARERVWITSPYFVPDIAMVTALQTAALRGVDVRILLPDRPDHLLVYLSAFSYLGEMETAGVKMFRYGDGFLHQKVMLVDDELASVGTPNLDNRSFRLNFEIVALVENRAFAAEVEAMLEADFAKAKPAPASEYTGRPIWFRIGVRAARLLAPVQ